MTYPYYYQNPYYQWNRPYQYPPTDTTIFNQSVVTFQKIAKDSAKILDKLSEPQFAHQIMYAAQVGNQHEVDRLIKSIGVPSTVITKYTPDGILLTIHGKNIVTQCCTLTMYLRWK
jgi:hypothetical protein